MKLETFDMSFLTTRSSARTTFSFVGIGIHFLRKAKVKRVFVSWRRSSSYDGLIITLILAPAFTTAFGIVFWTGVLIYRFSLFDFRLGLTLILTKSYNLLFD